MTITETRPEAAEGRGPAPAPTAPDTWVTSGDHKRIGLLFIWIGLLALLVGAVLAGLFHLEPFGDGVDVWTGNRSTLASAAVAALFVVGLPAVWLGVATYVVPLQIGATRVALPRLQLTSLWTLLVGAVILAVGFAVDRPAGFGLGGGAPPAAEEGASAAAATEMVIVGIALVALATLLAAVGILATLLSQRADSVTFSRLPLFSWSALATTSVLVLATPVFLGGLVLLYIDQHYGGTLFAARSRGGLKVWQHHLWVFGRPEALLLAAPALGVISEIVASAVRRPVVGFPVARASVVAAALMTLLAWAAGATALDSPVVPTPTVPTAAVALPVGLLALCWLATLRTGRLRFQPALPFASGFLAVLGLAAVAAAVAAVAGVEGPDVTPYMTAQVTLVVLGAPLVGAAGALHHWAPKLAGRPMPAGLATLQALLLVGGAVVAALPGYAVGLGGEEGIAPLGAAGYLMIALGLLPFVPMLLARRPAPAPAAAAAAADRPAGITLEWATASPPPPHNFDDLPEVDSPYPLLDRAGEGVTR